MYKPIITVENLSKRYILSHQGEREKYVALRDVITNKTKNLFNGFTKRAQSEQDQHLKNYKGEFWALKDVSFEVNQGDTIGIIGRNGAGKSTLLKILSRITEPTEGKITINGRVASLLEVGTGFHPELTGRENIYLNGAILGMTRAEIKSKFDEIVDFAEIEKFLDTPVKRYSSGMYVRLAFAVAAHLNPEILIVDEVLAVGDAQFQKKCLGKMGTVSKEEGKTVLFVSHNMGAIKKICNKGILLEDGHKRMEGDITKITNVYTTNGIKGSLFKPFEIEELGLVVKNISLNKNNNGIVMPGEPLVIEIAIEAERDVDKIGIQLMISNDDTSGTVFMTNTKTTNNLDITLKRGLNTITCSIKSFNLCSGSYLLGFGIDNPFIKFYYHETSIISFTVSEKMFAYSNLPTLPAYGHVYLEHNWKTNE